MGVATGDTNEDGLLDLFITNFYRQSNTLFVQHSGLSFIDSTRRAELANPSLMLLGWGTQFIDGDLDGRPDLVLTNGHVEKRSDEPFEMRPQFFHNQGDGRFIELPRKALGGYFQRDYVGRSMARLDWNRDGREDFVVSNIAGPVSLATNQTENVGHYLAIQLRGTVSSRDAIGATVWVSIGEQTRMQQLTAGDGYQASNEKRLVFGLADHDRIDELKIRWPDGKEQAWSNLPADSQWLAIEGAAELYRQ